MIFFCCFFIAVHDDPIRTDLWLLLGQEQPVKNHSLFIFSILHSFLSDRMYMASSEKVRPQQHGNQNNRSCPSTSPNAAVELSSLQPWHTTLHQLHDQDRQEWKAGWAFFWKVLGPSTLLHLSSDVLTSVHFCRAQESCTSGPQSLCARNHFTFQ